MADFIPRTIDQIYQALIIEKETFPSLSGLTGTISSEQDLLTQLTSDSKVAIWNLWLYITAVSIWSLEIIMKSFVEEVQEIKESAIIGTKNWYVGKSKDFQYGDTLVIDPVTYAVTYTEEDTTKQIVEHCAAVEIGSNLILKVRRKDTDTFSVPELDAFKSYIKHIKFAGVRTQIWNYSSDLLKLYFTIVYDPITPETTIKANVESIINSYIENIEFNSFFNVNKLVDELQQITNVIDPRFEEGFGKFDVEDYVEFEHQYQATAGYCSIDPSFPLDVTITYEAKI